MKNEIISFIKEYTTNVETVNKLIVSSFLYSNGINKVKNTHINSLMIRKSDADYKKLDDFNIRFTIDSLEKVVEAFEYVISPEDKVVSGAVYTPAMIREFIIDSIFEDINDVKGEMICDPACGCSGFLITAIEKIKNITGKKYKKIIEENIYGLDIKGFAIERSKILLALLSIVNGEDHEDFKFNLYEGNALSFKWSDVIKKFKGFDAIVGNPPYVCSRNIDRESKDLLTNWVVSSTGHPDLYIPFFELGMKNLKPRGQLGYITMNTFFKSLNGRALRNYFSTKSFKFKIIDFGSNQIFSSNNTYTCLCLMKNEASDFISFSSSDKGELKGLKYTSILYSSLNNYNGWNLKLPKIISKIESIGKPFSSLFKTSSGVATLKNDVYIFEALKEDDEYYYTKENIPLEKGLCRNVINTNKLTKIKNINAITKKIIFPYEYEGVVARPISEKALKKQFPKGYEYLLSKKSVLSTRDKGNGKYPEWFSYGRNQSLEKYKYKLLFPHIAPDSPNFIISRDTNLLFHNGLGLLDNDLSNIKLAQKIMSSRLFWFYIEQTSKPYGAGYMSLSKNYIKSFGVYDFTEDEKSWLIKEKDQGEVDKFLEEKYEVLL